MQAAGRFGTYGVHRVENAPAHLAQPGQRHPTALTCRQCSAGAESLREHPETLKCVSKITVGIGLQLTPGLQILPGCQHATQTIPVPQPMPGRGRFDRAFPGTPQAGGHLQQGGLARAIGAGQVHHLASDQAQRKSAHQHPLAAAGDNASERQQGHGPRSVREGSRRRHAPRRADYTMRPFA